jgi:hypothetical protein
MGKMCSLSRHTTSLLSGIASLECKLVKNANLGVCLLFTGVEFWPTFSTFCAKTREQNTLEPLAILYRVTC